MAYARMIISGEFLRQLMSLPEDTEIVGSREHLSRNIDGGIEIVVYSKGIPQGELVEGQLLPIVSPTFCRGEDGAAKFVAWNVQS